MHLQNVLFYPVFSITLNPHEVIKKNVSKPVNKKIPPHDWVVINSPNFVHQKKQEHAD